MSDNGIDLEALKDKLAKLLAKAEGTDNEAEAESFMAKVNELLERHQIGLHEIRKRLGLDKDPMGHARGENDVSTTLAWYRMAAVAIAKYYGCEFIYSTVKGKYTYNYTLVGRESSRITAEMMMPFVISQVRQLAKKYMREVNAKAIDHWGSQQVAKRYGALLTEVKAQTHVGLALVDRIWKLIHANEVHRKDLESRALVPVDGHDEYIANTFGELRKGRNSTGHTTETARKYADQVSLHYQTGHDAKAKIGG